MIANDELKATLKRLELIVNNCENPVEQYAAMLMIQNLSGLTKQVDMISDTPEFKAQAEEWSKENGAKK